MASVEGRRVAVTERPKAAEGVDELGLPRSLVLDICLRRALFDGETSTQQLADSLAVGTWVMEEVVEELRRLRYVEVRGLEGRSYRLELTDLGYEHALERMQLCRYAGPLPVSLDEYATQVRFQQQRPAVHRASLRRALDDLVIGDALLAELGPAMQSVGPMFLYGPPGTGKSAIAERLVDVFEDDVLIPHAVEVDGQIITVFDQVIHQPTPEQPEHVDRRWVRCRRPRVVAGGELTLGQLDLSRDEPTGIHLAPLQLKANNGVLVIDDLGRQQVAPETLLNRWLVPMDRGIDHLTLSQGVEFEVPCLSKLVFCTNLPPASLGDEAFFRRIRGKVRVGPIGDDEFDEIFRRVTEKLGLTPFPGAEAHLRQASRERGDGDLRPYLPDAICELSLAIAEYEERPPVLDRALLDRAVTLFLTQDRAMREVGHNAGLSVPTPVDG